MCRLAILVEAPASVEEAVALLLGTQDKSLRHAASLAYIRRLYSSFLVVGPSEVTLERPHYQWLFDSAIHSGAQPFLCP
jgi:hypothetical protein